MEVYKEQIRKKIEAATKYCIKCRKGVIYKHAILRNSKGCFLCQQCFKTRDYSYRLLDMTNKQLIEIRSMILSYVDIINLHRIQKMQPTIGKLVDQHMVHTYGCNWFIRFDSINYEQHFDYDEYWPALIYWHNFAQTINILDQKHLTKSFSAAFRYLLEPRKLILADEGEKDIFWKAWARLKTQQLKQFETLDIFTKRFKKTKLYDFYMKTESVHSFDIEPYRLKLVFTCFVKNCQKNTKTYFRIFPKHERTVQVKTDRYFMLKHNNESYLLIPQNHALYISQSQDVAGTNRSPYLAVFIYKDDLFPANAQSQIGNLGIKQQWLQTQRPFDIRFTENSLTLLIQSNCMHRLEDQFLDRINPEIFNRRSLNVVSPRQEDKVEDFATPQKKFNKMDSKKKLYSRSLKLDQRIPSMANLKNIEALPELESDSDSDSNSSSASLDLTAHMTMYNRGFRF